MNPTRFSVPFQILGAGKGTILRPPIFLRYRRLPVVLLDPGRYQTNKPVRPISPAPAAPPTAPPSFSNTLRLRFPAPAADVFSLSPGILQRPCCSSIATSQQPRLPGRHYSLRPPPSTPPPPPAAPTCLRPLPWPPPLSSRPLLLSPAATLQLLVVAQSLAAAQLPSPSPTPDRRAARPQPAPPNHQECSAQPPEHRSLATRLPTGHQTPFLALSGGIWSKAPSTYNPVVLKGMEHKIGEAIVRTLSDTFASEAATVSMHATHFSKLVVEEQEKQHELKALHVALIVDHKRIFIENAKLKNDLAMQDSTSAVGPRLEELEKMREEIQKTREEAEK
ncbi:leucine-rich repeat extensin-like protein 5 [Cryptomeria japonica]|uniref:leucine-rich repeat extensin-like protein 5 n=1 Tax=Cryptomeria japonica TaxID=3369 RepID=UPI0027DA81C8|nr:leucine-rich repeat extensin-like protein 5 [Cryptomeria japonica]